MGTTLKEWDKQTLVGGSRFIGGLPLLIIMTLDGNSGIDLLDATINYVTSLAGTIG